MKTLMMLMNNMKKTEKIVTDIVAQNIGGEIFTGKSVNRLLFRGYK